MARQRKKPDKHGKRKWLGEVPDPDRPGRTIYLGTFDSEGEAKDAEAEARIGIKKREFTAKSKTKTVEFACLEYIAADKRRVAGDPGHANTQEDNERIIKKHIIPHLGTIKLTALTKSAVQDWVWEMVAGSHGASHKNRLWALKLVMYFAADDDRRWITLSEVMLLFRRLVVPKREQFQPQPTKEDVRLYLKTLNKFYPDRMAPMLVAISTGARSGEIKALRWKDCDFDNRVFTFAKSTARRVKMGATKGRKTREGAEMTKDVREVLMDEWEAQGRPIPEAICFPALRSGDIFDIWSVHNKVMKKAELRIVDERTGRIRNKFGVHGFRRYYVSELKERIGLAAASEAIDHASVEQTRAYARKSVVNPRRRSAVEDIVADVLPREQPPLLVLHTRQKTRQRG
jgi:integrase